MNDKKKRLFITESVTASVICIFLKYMHGFYPLADPDMLFNMRITIEAVAVGILFQIFVVNLFLYLNNRDYPANLYFALLCLVFAIRTGYVENKVLYHIFFRLPEDFAIRAERLALPLTLLILYLLAKTTLTGTVKKLHLRIVSFVCGIFIIAIIIFDVTLSKNLLYPFYIFYIIAGLNLSVRSLICIRKTQKEQAPELEMMVIAIGCSILLYSALHDSIHYNTDINQPLAMGITDALLFAYAIFHMIAFMYATTRDMRLGIEKEAALTAERDMLSSLNELKNEFYADISHEMKTPLTLISMNSQFAARRIRAGKISPDMAEDLEAVSTEARRLAAMVTGLVELGKAQSLSGHDGRVDLKNLVEDMVKVYLPMYERYGNKITIDIKCHEPIIRGDSDQILQVFINIFGNANRHTRNGTINCSISKDEGFCRVEIQDTGEGIREDILPHVFDRYYKGDKGNVGLGLYICKSIIERHGGSTGISSTEGEGTLVWFKLPLAQDILMEKKNG